jgi:anionic cell wall polymer biosynthesis LytR-Cps2A-Psr (LCP) family protein
MSSNPSPAIAAILSFIFPGAGQIYAGQVRKGLIWAIPMVLFIIGVIVVITGGQTGMLGLISSSEKRLALLTMNVAFFLYHLAAMFDAYSVAKRDRYRGYGTTGIAPIVLAAVVSLTIVLHGLPEVYGIQAHNALSQIFNHPGDGGPVIPSFSINSLAPTTPGPSTNPTATPAVSPTASPSQTSGTSGSPGPTGSARPTTAPKVCPPAVNLASWPGWAQDGRLNILVVGTDSRSETGVDDNSLRTDTMLLLTVDIQSCKAAMFSFPRNMCTPSIEGSCGPPGIESRYPDWLRIPLPAESAGSYPNGTFPDFLNALWRRAAEQGDKFPGSEGVGQECAQDFTCTRAWRALVGTIQEMSGVPIDGITAVNLKGFVSVIDNLPPQCPDNDVRVALTNADCYGGVWIDVPEAVHDEIYHTSQQQQIEIDIERGCQYFDAEMALAYSRSRHETSDYDRARRQQYVLTQIRKQLDPIGLLPHIPALLQVAAQNLYLGNFSDADIPYLAEAASRIDADRIYRYDFAPNKVAALESMQGMRDLVTNIFEQPEPDPEPPPSGDKCPPR